MITWWMKLGGNLTPGHDAQLFSTTGRGHGWTYQGLWLGSHGPLPRTLFKKCSTAVHPTTYSTTFPDTGPWVGPNPVRSGSHCSPTFQIVPESPRGFSLQNCPLVGKSTTTGLWYHVIPQFGTLFVAMFKNNILQLDRKHFLEYPMTISVTH